MKSTVLIDDPLVLWDRICVELQKQITPDAFKRFFSPVSPKAFDAGRLTLKVENTIYQYWIESNYMTQLKAAAELVVGKVIEFGFECAPAAASTQVAVEQEAPSTNASASFTPSHSELITRYTFDSFVVGVNNQFAHAAALAVAERPATTYNPLLIHGDTGLGKTHLLHAIGNRILARKPRARILYVTSEQFTVDFVGAIQHGDLAKFRKRYRQVDALLIDDVQFFGKRDRSQEEFFHTFNALYDGSKQIVLSSDAPASEVPDLERRLVSRLEWGLTAELQPPDIETRLAILRKKTAGMHVRLGDSVLSFIAERIKANVRRLEGALNRVAAWAALHDRQITQAQVEELLGDFIQLETRKAATVDAIQRHVAEACDIRLADMTSKRRPANIAMPRMLAMYLSRKLTSKSLQEIGEAFGGRDHGTVLHAVKTIEQKINADQQLQALVHSLTNKLEHEPQ